MEEELFDLRKKLEVLVVDVLLHWKGVAWVSFHWMLAMMNENQIQNQYYKYVQEQKEEDVESHYSHYFQSHLGNISSPL
ncbi:hypothetical protein KXD40_002949 [Peronospora effusa]|uniref:Uncharacterized protein n=1 Tax=Peronospora effusa TaxID=542832 RepID=A0A3M6VRY8_9STRA|nr:hypothetical protein DD238_003122 [Peronospora effusa]RQM14764.1 hypothetical protein DD237_002181 [Peronospora effusa]UIZ29927.1 hypothetical protein KXD40_002949 [Peronospora effusa]